MFVAACSTEPSVARFSHHWATEHPAAIQAKEFARLINERTEGQLTVEIFPAGQLYGIRQSMGALAAGSVELAGLVGIVSFPPIERNYNLTHVPGLFTSFVQQRRFFEETPTGRSIWEALTTEVGIRLIAYNPIGPMVTFSTRTTIEGLTGLAGMKARVLASVDRPRWKALKADRMISLPTAEVYYALQSGMINALVTPPGAIKSYSWWEYLRSAQLPQVAYSEGYIMANRRWFSTLSPEVQTIFQEVGRRISVEATDSIMASSETILDEFRERGGHITEFEGEDLAALRQLETGVMARQYEEMIDADVFESVVEYTRNP